MNTGNTRTLRVELYGPLKEVLGESVTIELPAKAQAADVLEALARLMGPHAGLLKGSALAGENEVLAPSHLIPSQGRLAVLPPVCGG
jgi:molybdopterin converting factor small subunit